MKATDICNGIDHIGRELKPIHVNELAMADRIRELEERLKTAETTIQACDQYINPKRHYDGDKRPCAETRYRNAAIALHAWHTA